MATSFPASTTSMKPPSTSEYTARKPSLISQLASSDMMGLQHYYSRLISDQKFALIFSFPLECGQRLEPCCIAYKTWGRLNEARDNVLVACHALTGSSDLGDWWSPMLGPGKTLDYTRYFIFCANCLGSPYGSHSPLTINPKTGRPFGRDFPSTTVRDDIRAQKLVLDALGVTSVAAVIGGSMGGMAVLEWPLCTPPGYVKNIIPIATAMEHSAWGISWAETQRQCILLDPAFNDGNYDPVPHGQPTTGLGTARKIAMLTYRSSMSFEARFGRKLDVGGRKELAASVAGSGKRAIDKRIVEHERASNANAVSVLRRNTRPHFSAQGYLNYQGAKFINRFDANCYLHLLDKMDRHDITRGRSSVDGLADAELRSAMLGNIPPGALVVGVESDILFPPSEQEKLAKGIPGATLKILPSTNGHDGFLVDFEELDRWVVEHLRERLPSVYEGPPLMDEKAVCVGMNKGESMVGEMEE